MFSANDYCKENRRSTISSVDIITAIKELEFHDLIGPLEEFLEHYRRDSTAKKERMATSTEPTTDPPVTADTVEEWTQ